ncbi:MAG TPA: quinolinate synthase [Deltaproteobacteria bacterium]|nr:MAG: quinolinate synthase [Deltaproteobacteria bacterium GWC2_65_14]HBO69588.1 quinolinate synthase [Deltaproteobacteria bacterium]
MSVYDPEGLKREIRELLRSRSAVMLAHNYQRDEIQEIADITGDSLGLSQEAAKTDAEVIVFCGVHFMAESAAILSPGKTVLLPRMEAGCPMADMVTADDLRAWREAHPGAVVVTYVNSSAEVKALSDICCTSGNAVNVVRSIPADREIFMVPDRNLAHYVAKKSGRALSWWDGYCPTHERLKVEAAARAKAEHPDALLVVHPECPPEVVEMADAVLSTSGIYSYCGKSDAKEFIIGTEMGILYRLRKENPGKVFHLASRALICPNMKLTTLEDVRDSLETLSPRVSVPAEIREGALAALEAMLAVPRDAS